MTAVNPIETLRAEHIQVRDALLDLLDAISQRDVEKALEILISLDKLTGPHFRFEEESFYPAVSQFFGEEYREYLLGAHDKVIRTAKELAGALGKGEISEEEARRLTSLIRTQVLPHPVECEGLGLFAERLRKEEMERIAANLEACQKADVPLLEWATSIRARKV
ncbi:MAG: hemerythrin domain-containing protein [Acidobacteria bacterium]|nr:hemerythrin domain-containing protein [Acidobacteriota bacterium]